MDLIPIFNTGLAHVSSLATSAVSYFSDGTPKTLLTAGAGAAIGAWLGSRAQAKRRVVDEINAIRSALAVCYSICNQFLAMKRQHTMPMKQAYERAEVAYNNRVPGQQVVVQLDMQTVTPMSFATDTLEKIVFEKCNATSKALVTVVALRAAAESLQLATKYRNDLCDEFRTKGPPNQLDRIKMYLAVPDAAGVTDVRFKTSVRGVYEQTDDGIFFSRYLADELLRYGTKLRQRNSWKYRLPVAKLEGADWTMAKEAGLIPPDSQYETWLRGFRERPTRWARFRAWVAKRFEPSPKPPEKPKYYPNN